MPDDYCVVLTTCATREEAEHIAELLVARRLASCVQISAVSSVYLWKGDLHKDPEHLLLIKTRAQRYAEIQSTILENHSYEVPEIVRLPIDRGLPAYLEWVSECTS
jgi:periplasmic divalent cation tolerance protein